MAFLFRLLRWGGELATGGPWRPDTIGAMSTPPDRLVALQGASNFRGLGGYAGLNGRPLCWQRLFRAPHLAGVTVADNAVLAALGIARDATSS